jgi:hypothetical protein
MLVPLHVQQWTKSRSGAENIFEGLKEQLTNRRKTPRNVAANNAVKSKSLSSKDTAESNPVDGVVYNSGAHPVGNDIPRGTKRCIEPMTSSGHHTSRRTTGGGTPSGQQSSRYKKLKAYQDPLRKVTLNDSISHGSRGAGMTLLFADTGPETYGAGVTDVVRDIRPGIEALDIQQVTLQIHTDVVIYPANLGYDNTVWNVIVEAHTNRTAVNEIVLGDKALPSPSRMTINNETLTMEVILYRVLSGTSRNIDHYVTSQTKEELAYAVLDHLCQSTEPTLIVGNMGFSLNFFTCMMKKYTVECRKDLDHIETLCSGDHDLLAFYNGPHAIHSVDFEQNPRIFILTFTPKSPQSDAEQPATVVPKSFARGGAHPSIATAPYALAKMNAMLRTREACIYEFCNAPNGHIDEEKRKLCQLLVLRPVYKSTSTDPTNGFIRTGPIDMEMSLDYFESIMAIIKNARSHAGVTIESQALNADQSKLAYDWLKRTFETDFLRNDDIKERMKLFKQDRAWFDTNLPRREGKRNLQLKTLRGRLRSARLAWEKDLFGCSPLTKAFLFEGMVDIKNIKQFIITLQEHKEKVKEGEKKGTAMRAATQKAREDIAHASWLVTNERYIQTSGQAELVAKLKSGELWRICKKATDAQVYTNGDIPKLSIHSEIIKQMASKRASGSKSPCKEKATSDSTHRTSGSVKRGRSATPVPHNEKLTSGGTHSTGRAAKRRHIKANEEQTSNSTVCSLPESPFDI